MTLQLNLTLATIYRTILALWEIDEELAIETSKLDTHSARELAGDGIFAHLPSIYSQPGATRYPRTARRIWRETSVGPLNPSWSVRTARDVPTIRIIKPEDARTPRTTAGPGAKPTEVRSASEATTMTSGRVRSNAVNIAPNPTTSFPPTSSTHINPSSSRPNQGHWHSNEAPKTSGLICERETSADRAKRLSGNRTSMCDWLAAISAGNNNLVADHVATKASPVLRASLALSPLSTPPLSPAGSASSSDSSTPSTPIDDFFLPPPLVEETKTACASGNRRWRARCSYSGTEYEMVVAPVIPEDLLTEEIGVAC